jgi:hypothetical protein
MAGDNVTTDSSQREQGSTIRRYIIWCSNHAYDECLRRIVERPNVVSRGTSLRRECMHAKRPDGPALSGERRPLLARAVSAQVKLADPDHAVRRPDRGSAPITRLVHLPPPVGRAGSLYQYRAAAGLPDTGSACQIQGRPDARPAAEDSRNQPFDLQGLIHTGAASPELRCRSRHEIDRRNAGAGSKQAAIRSHDEWRGDVRRAKLTSSPA